MEIFKIAGLAVLALGGVILLRAYRPEMALQLSLGTGVVLFAYALTEIGAVQQVIEGITGRYGLGSQQIKLIFKVFGMAYVAQFAAEACRDAGESAIASKVELVGRVMIVAAALPAVFSVLDLLSGLLGGV